jgi:hypothetical protein
MAGATLPPARWTSGWRSDAVPARGLSRRGPGAGQWPRRFRTRTSGTTTRCEGLRAGCDEVRRDNTGQAQRARPDGGCRPPMGRGLAELPAAARLRLPGFGNSAGGGERPRFAAGLCRRPGVTFRAWLTCARMRTAAAAPRRRRSARSCGLRRGRDRGRPMGICSRLPGRTGIRPASGCRCSPLPACGPSRSRPRP